MKVTLFLRFIVCCVCQSLLTAVHADDVYTFKTIGMELARDIASESVLACRKQGYAVSAAVVDRNAILKVVMRDDLAPRFTLQIAEKKANMAMMSGINSGEFRNSREDIRAELNHIDGLIVMQGGVIISAGGVRIGAVGVSGAPGGDLDEACALKALDKLIERLEFAD
jgi:uncharacterized protein GlcG (DUF336 family)